MYSVLTKVPEYRYPLYRSTGIRCKKVVLKCYIYNPSNNKNIQPVHEDSKFRTVDLGRTELGTLRTCARVPRARVRAACGKQIHQTSPLLFVRVLRFSAQLTGEVTTAQVDTCTVY